MMAASLLTGAAGREGSGPALLFCTPKSGDMSHAWVDWTWLRELHEAGFEVDVTDGRGLDELTWERVRHFNVLFLYASPDALARQWRGMPSEPAEATSEDNKD